MVVQFLRVGCEMRGGSRDWCSLAVIFVSGLKDEKEADLSVSRSPPIAGLDLVEL